MLLLIIAAVAAVAVLCFVHAKASNELDRISSEFSRRERVCILYANHENNAGEIRDSRSIVINAQCSLIGSVSDDLGEFSLDKNRIAPRNVY